MFNCVQLVKSIQTAPDVRRREALGLALLESLYPMIRGYVRARVPRDSCDDVTQEAMLSIVKGLDTLRCEGDGQFRNWCYQIARRRIANLYRSQGRQPEILSLEVMQELHRDLAASGRLGAEEREVIELLRALDPELFESVWARFCFDIDWKDLASELNLTPDALRMKINRAFSKLRKTVQEPV